MASVRSFTTVVMVGVLSAAAGTPGTARAQASGTLQASATVLDDAVSRSVFARLAAAPAITTGRPGPVSDPVELLRLESVRAWVTRVDRVGQVLRVRLEIVYLN